MKKRLGEIAFVILILALIGIGIKLFIFPDTMPECPTEDSGTNCIWNAPNSGNGLGRSFVTDDNGDIAYYLD